MTGTVLLLTAACGARPQPAPVTPTDDTPRPGWHGCTTCRVVGCMSAGMNDVDEIVVRVALETQASKVSYRSATLEISPGGAQGAQAKKLDATGWAPGEEYVVKFSASDLSMTDESAWKNARARLKVLWDEPDGTYGKALDLPIEAGSCGG